MEVLYNLFHIIFFKNLALDWMAEMAEMAEMGWPAVWPEPNVYRDNVDKRGIGAIMWIIGDRDRDNVDNRGSGPR